MLECLVQIQDSYASLKHEMNKTVLFFLLLKASCCAHLPEVVSQPFCCQHTEILPSQFKTGSKYIVDTVCLIEGARMFFFFLKTGHAVFDKTCNMHVNMIYKYIN